MIRQLAKMRTLILRISAYEIIYVRFRVSVHHSLLLLLDSLFSHYLRLYHNSENPIVVIMYIDENAGKILKNKILYDITIATFQALLPRTGSRICFHCSTFISSYYSALEFARVRTFVYFISSFGRA